MIGHDEFCRKRTTRQSPLHMPRCHPGRSDYHSGRTRRSAPYTTVGDSASPIGVFCGGCGNRCFGNGLLISLRSEGERERKMRGNPLFAKSRIPPHPLRQKLLNMILQSSAGDKLVIVSRRLRNHLGAFGMGVQSRETRDFAKGFFS